MKRHLFSIPILSNRIRPQVNPSFEKKRHKRHPAAKGKYLVWKIRRKSGQIMHDDTYFLFYLLFLLCWAPKPTRLFVGPRPRISQPEYSLTSSHTFVFIFINFNTFAGAPSVWTIERERDILTRWIHFFYGLSKWTNAFCTGADYF
jgi:hypothetical protein